MDLLNELFQLRLWTNVSHFSFISAHLWGKKCPFGRFFSFYIYMSLFLIVFFFFCIIRFLLSATFRCIVRTFSWTEPLGDFYLMPVFICFFNRSAYLFYGLTFSMYSKSNQHSKWNSETKQNKTKPDEMKWNEKRKNTIRISTSDPSRWFNGWNNRRKVEISFADVLCHCCVYAFLYRDGRDELCVCSTNSKKDNNFANRFHFTRIEFISLLNFWINSIHAVWSTDTNIVTNFRLIQWKSKRRLRQFKELLSIEHIDFRTQ